MWVKICGNTNLEDVLTAAAHGADAVGFVFAPSPRQVTPAQVADLTARLPTDIERIGVFPAWSAAEIAAAARETGLTAAQLHGGLNLDLLHELRNLAPELHLIQVLHWTIGEPEADAQLRTQLQQLRAEAPFVGRVLIDSKFGAATGGTGVAFDWTAARDLFAEEHGGLRLILAGGLKPENIAQAIASLRPWGIDVSSGVEIAPGKKDTKKIASFIEEARSGRAD